MGDPPVRLGEREVARGVSMAAERSGKPLRLAAVESAKFLSPIRPGEEIQVRYRRREQDGKALYDATLAVGGKTAAAFLLQVDEGDGTP